MRTKKKNISSGPAGETTPRQKKSVADHGDAALKHHGQSKPFLSERKATISIDEVIPFVETDDAAAYIPYDSSSSISSSDASDSGKQRKKPKRARKEVASAKSAATDQDPSHVNPKMSISPWKEPPIPSVWNGLVPTFKASDVTPEQNSRDRSAFFKSNMCRIERRRAAIESSRYIADEPDLRFCLEHRIPIALFSKIVTQLDRSFAEFLLQEFRQAQATSIAFKNSDTAREKAAGGGDVSSSRPTTGIAAHYCGGCGTQCREDVPFVACKTCGVVAHAPCALLPQNEPLPQRWKCDVCRSADDVAAIRCAVCERGGGLFLRMRLQNIGWTRYGHVACALLLPELRIDPVSRTIVAEQKFDRRRMQMCCIDCGKIGTPCVQCHHPRCFTAMHPSCAVAAHRQETRKCSHSALKSPTDISLPADLSAHAVYCPQHFSAIYDIASAVGQDKGKAGTAAEQYALEHIKEALETSPELIPQPEPVGVAKVKKIAPPTPSISVDAVAATVCQYWKAKRETRMIESAALVAKINHGQADILEALFRPEIMKVGSNKVQLARFVCLTPEVQLFTAEMIEGVAPVKDYERVVPSRQTRRSGNTDGLFGTMVRVQDQIKHVGGICQNIKARVELDRQLTALDVRLLDAEMANALAAAHSAENRV